MDSVGSYGGVVRGLNPNESAKGQELLKCNIKCDNYFSFQPHIGESPHFIKRNCNFIAHTDGGQIALYDLVARRRIWSCSFDLPEEEFTTRQFLRDLKVSSDGTVLVHTNNIYQRNNKYVIFSEGNQLGTVELSNFWYKDSLKVINSGKEGIFALSNTLDGAEYFSCWDINGNKISEIKLGRWATVQIAKNDLYFVATGVDSHSVKVFVHDLIISNTNTFIFGKSEYPIRIESLAIYKDKAIIGMGYEKEMDDFVRVCEAKITVLNVLTGALEAEYRLDDEKGYIEKFIVNDDYIIMLINRPGNPFNSLGDLKFVQVIDRLSGQQKTIWTIPTCQDGFRCKMYLSGNWLHCCYPMGDTKEDGFARQEHIIYDLSENKIVKEISYNRRGTEKMSFQDGRLMIWPKDNKVIDAIYVEDFNQGLVNNQQSNVDHDRWGRLQCTFL